METKLTLRLKKEIIEKAKEFASIHRISLSKLIESYLESITVPKEQKSDISPLVESLSGVISLDNDYDYKREYGKFLTEKYR